MGKWRNWSGEVEKWRFETGFLALLLEVRLVGLEPDGEGSSVALKLLESLGWTGWGGLQPISPSSLSKPVRYEAAQKWVGSGGPLSGLLPVGLAGGWQLPSGAGSDGHGQMRGWEPMSSRARTPRRVPLHRKVMIYCHLFPALLFGDLLHLGLGTERAEMKRVMRTPGNCICLQPFSSQIPEYLL